MESSTRTATQEPEDLIEIDGDYYRRHRSGGGLVSVTALVSPSARIDREAMVKHHAVIGANVRLFHRSVVEDLAVVIGMTTLREDSRIGGNAVVNGVNLRGNAYVGGSSQLEGPIVVEASVRLVDIHLKGRYRFT